MEREKNSIYYTGDMTVIQQSYYNTVTEEAKIVENFEELYKAIAKDMKLYDIHTIIVPPFGVWVIEQMNKKIGEYLEDNFEYEIKEI